MRAGRLLLVSNRLPVTIVRASHGVTVEPSAGGLATALRGPHRRSDSLWIGWPEDVSRLSRADRGRLEERLAQLRAVPVHLRPSDVSRYYDGFSNGVLWPLFHYLLDKVRRDAEQDWPVYEDVNRRFADRIAEVVRPGDVVWVHDYQLMLLPAMLRARVPAARIGFFLHVPFPSPDVFRILPAAARLAEGVLGADVVGFHTDRYRRNFVETAVETLGAEARDGGVRHGGREIAVQVHPISIDAGDFVALARAPSTQARAEEIRREAGGRKIMLGIDRLDYTKGIPRRLLAFDRLLTRDPALRAEVLFIQVAVPTRERVDAYAELRRKVNELTGRINAQHATPTSFPLALLYRRVPLEELVALYRAADVMLVTPVRDGMNLVAKEYVATRFDGTGALVLSQFVGAAAELTRALVVNPYDQAALVDAMRAALDMGAAEQAERMRSMHDHVTRHDVARWVDGFLAALTPRSPNGTKRS